MGKLIWIIIGIVTYFAGGWIAKDIVFSMTEITGDMTLGDITFYECLTYSVIAGVISVVASLYKSDGDIEFIPLMFIVGILGCIKTMPISLGLIILYNIVNVSCIIWAICTNRNIN